jgi:hypothetical protein
MLHHNKKRNTHLLHEFLVRQVVQCVMDGKDPKPIIQLTKKYFAPGSVLCEEDNLFNIILKCKKDRNVLTKVIDEIKKFAVRLDTKKLDIEKTRLIDEVRKLGCEKMYDHKVKDYTLFASIQTLINNVRGKSIIESVSGIHLEENIINLLLSEDHSNDGKYAGKQPNYHLLMMIDSITEDLKKMPLSQRELVLEYIDAPQNGEFNFIDKRLAENAKIIERNMGKFGDDTNKKMKLFACKVKEAVNTKDKFTMLLESQELVDELVAVK